MKYHLISALLLALAVVFETLGVAGAVTLLGAGVACETWFWMRLVRRRRPEGHLD